MPCRSGGTGRAWRSCEWSRASEDVPSVGISSGKLHTRMVSLLNEFFCGLSSLTLRNTPCRRRRSYVLLHLCEVSRHVTPGRTGDRTPWGSRNTEMV